MTSNSEHLPDGIRGEFNGRERPEEAWRQEAQKYRSLFENSAAGMFQSTPEGKFLIVNRVLARMLGYSSPDEFISAIEGAARRLFADPERGREYARRLEEQGAVLGFECQWLCRDGSASWVSLCARAVLSPAGEAVCHEGTVGDISGRKSAEAAQRESESILHSFFDSADMMRGIVELVDDDILFVSGNPASAAFFGLTGETLANRLASDLEVPAESLQMWIGRFQESRQTGVPVSFDHVYGPARGQRFLSTVVTFLGMGQSGRPRFGYVTSDVTARKRLEAQFLQSQKMEAIGNLAGGIAHDFNNLLTVINGCTEFLLSDLARDDPRRNDLEQIRQAGQRAVSLTSQLLAFSRKQVFQLRNVDLNYAIAQTSTILRRLIGENIDLVIVPQPDLWPVKADPGQMQQIIMNLAVNARDAMPRGGKLTIETANVDLDEDQFARHAVMPAGAYVMVAISDDGLGMDAETQARIFEPFFTTKRQSGTGLGLSTVYGIVKQSGGFIWVYSEAERGTTFKIYLPRVRGEADNIAGPEKKELPLQGTETVLVVEDEPSVRTLTARILHRRGYTVLEASDSREALGKAREFAGEIHLVLTDVVLPEMSGKWLAGQIQDARPGAKVLFVSGYTNDAIVHHGVLDSNVAFLQKPFTADTLARKVREVLDSVA
jgi:two-component system cell cycle sensor histidine kinase/response regulator CckA